ncbi:MAG: EamA family transporter [Gemmatimonadota bacterium]
MWILLSLLAAILWSGREGVMKGAGGVAGPLLLTVGLAGVTFLLLAPVALLQGEGVHGPGFWPALVVSASVNSICTLLIARSVVISDLSLVAPLQSFTPVFMLLWAPWALQEVPSVGGVLGVLVVVAGAYLLAAPSAGGGWMAPLRALWEDGGARLMLAVALLFSFSATADKVGVLASGPLLWGAAMHGGMVAILGPFAAWRWLKLRRTPAGSAGVRGAPVPWILAAGVLNGVMMGVQMTAYTLSLAAYVIAVKRSSILFSILLGRVFFHEMTAGKRLPGAVLMLVGFLLLTLLE